MLLVFLLLAASFSFASVIAADVEVVATPIKNAIAWDSTATYTIKITNEGSTGDIFRLRPASFSWGSMTFDNTVFTIPAHGSATTKLYLSPPRDVKAGDYAVEVLAISNSNPDIRGSDLLDLTVTSELPHIEPEWGIPENLEPGQTDVNLIVKNTGGAATAAVKAVLSSDLLPEPIIFDVAPLGKGEARIIWSTSLDIPLDTVAKAYSFKLAVYQDGKEISTYTHPVSVMEKEFVDVRVMATGGFLGTGYVVAIKNIGNTFAADSYSTVLPSWQRLFLHSAFRPSVTGYGTFVEAAWPYQLDMGQQAILTYKISYVPLLALMLALLVMLYTGAWVFRQEITLTKELVTAEKALKVNLRIKNTYGKPVRNVVIEDTVPTPLKLKGFESEKPKAIKKIGGAVKLLWKFDNIWPGEEKVLSYNLKSALGLVGTIMLPPAKGKRKAAAGETPRLYISNGVSVPANVRVLEEEPRVKD